MARKVLVLNSDYRALTVCSVPKAFLLVYMNKAEVINKAENEFLRSVSQILAMPSVIRLHTYVNMPYKGVMLSRQNIFRRDGHKCEYCGSKHDLTLDHVLPRSKGGKTAWNNLVTACKSCNAKKSDFNLEDVGLRLPYKPFKPSFVVFLREFIGSNDETWKPFLQGKEGCD